MTKEIITENKVVLDENGKIKFILTEETSAKGFPIDEGIALAKQLSRKIIEANMKKNGKYYNRGI